VNGGNPPGNLTAETTATGTPLRDYIYQDGERVAMKVYGGRAPEPTGLSTIISEHRGLSSMNRARLSGRRPTCRSAERRFSLIRLKIISGCRGSITTLKLGCTIICSGIMILIPGGILLLIR
jgi:hypothetical protein